MVKLDGDGSTSTVFIADPDTSKLIEAAVWGHWSKFNQQLWTIGSSTRESAFEGIFTLLRKELRDYVSIPDTCLRKTNDDIQKRVWSWDNAHQEFKEHLPAGAYKLDACNVCKPS